MPIYETYKLNFISEKIWSQISGLKEITEMWNEAVVCHHIFDDTYEWDKAEMKIGQTWKYFS
jgi:hypothetical protein